MQILVLANSEKLYSNLLLASEHFTNYFLLKPSSGSDDHKGQNKKKMNLIFIFLIKKFISLPNLLLIIPSNFDNSIGENP